MSGYTHYTFNSVTGCFRDISYAEDYLSFLIISSLKIGTSKLFISVSLVPTVQLRLMFVDLKWKGFLWCFQLSKPLDHVRDGPVLF